MQSLDRGYGLGALDTLACNLDVSVPGKQGAESSAGQWLVVDDEGTDLW